MTIEVKEGTGTGAGEEPKGGQPASGGSSEKPKAEAKSEPKEKEKETPKPKAETKGEGEKPSKTEPKHISEDDEIPEDSELVSMSKQALTKRLTRHTKKELRDRFGTDDMDKIKADLEELKTLRAEKEENRRKQLSEIERAKEDAAKEKKRADDAEKKHQQALDAQSFAEYDAQATEALAESVAPKHVKRALRELKEHVMTLDEADLKNPKKVFAQWTKEFVKENPEFAKPAEEPPKKVGLTTGPKTNTKPEKGNIDLATKTPMPGKANSMSRAEYMAYKRERGLA
jgi:hypothetical protein